MKPSIVLVGEESVGLRILRELDDRGADLELVLSDGPVRRLANAMGYPAGPADRVRDPAFPRAIAGVDLLLNAHSLYILPDEVVEAPSLGAYNLHPGPLPEYAGLNAPCWAIYEGASEYGVTLHRIVTEIDAGSITYETRWSLDGTETALALWTRCGEEGVELLRRLLDVVDEGGDVPARSQDLERRRYYERGPPAGGRITWAEDAAVIERFVRACEFGPFDSPWGRPRASLGGREVELVGAAIGDEAAGVEPGTSEELESGRYRVAAADRWLAVNARLLTEPAAGN